MRATVVHTVSPTLPPDEVHPYRTGAWTPNHREWDATDLDVVEGAIPDDLAGVYLRNTENPVHDSIGLYHPFDGDGMVHQIAFANGTATYRNRFVQRGSGPSRTRHKPFGPDCSIGPRTPNVHLEKLGCDVAASELFAAASVLLRPLTKQEERCTQRRCGPTRCTRCAVGKSASR